MLREMWDSVMAGKMFVSTSDGIPGGAGHFCSPTTTVAKKLPDRTISSDLRLIWDGGRAHLRCPKGDYWQCETPSIVDLSARYCSLRTSFPGIPILGTKRDIDSAPTRVRLHPDGATMFGSDFDVDKDRKSTMAFFYLVFPSGFSGSPGIFGRIMDAVQTYHRPFAPATPERNGDLPYYDDVFVGDAMFLEASIGHRQGQTVKVWDRAAEYFFGHEAVGKKKLDVEGRRGCRLILLGFEVNLEEDVIELPGPKILGAINLVSATEFNPGCLTLSVRALQELRGSINHWSQTGYIWRFSTEPINQMIGHTDSSGVWVRCSDWDKWAALWSVIQFVRDLTLFAELSRRSLVYVASSLRPLPNVLVYGFRGTLHSTVWAV